MMKPPTPIERCRISGSAHLLTVLQLGEQALTGVFPRRQDEEVTRGPLDLVWCPESGLLQLRHSYDLSELYGDNYGYRSGLNSSMIKHLSQTVRHVRRLRPVDESDVVLDIGSNDGTTLNSYCAPLPQRIGMDPTGRKFARYYDPAITLVPTFFSAADFMRASGGRRASIVTSIAMFYDLERPLDFVKEVASVLEPDGIWHSEQSYMPTMLRLNAYDTICHEHLEYYSLSVIRNLLEQAGLIIINAQMNAVNGGSIAITAARRDSPHKEAKAMTDWLIAQEDRMGLSTPRPFRRFEERVFEHRSSLRSLIKTLNADGKRVVGYGASTKGNVLLQFCGLTTEDLICIAEVNEDKFNTWTPGTKIPIVSEAEARQQKPDYMLVLPWHFRSSILEREQEFLANGGKLIFPLPEIEIV
jgi:hypothetical protein